jgi:hypothetical protein
MCSSNTPNWVDSFGDGCDWYEKNDYPGCPIYGHESGYMGSASENCCYCFPLSLDTPDWVDEFGDGCDWYENYDYPGCPMYGHTGGNMGSPSDYF